MNKYFLFSISILFLLFHAQTNAAIYRDLSVGSVGQDVFDLQKFLNSQPDTQISLFGAGSPGQETDYFGDLTKKAVIKLQEKFRSTILTPVGLYSGTGFVGGQTRSLINSMLSGSNNTNNQVNTTPNTINSIEIPNTNIQTSPNQSTLVKISSISPTEGSDGTLITITGTGFTNKNTVLVDLDSRYKYTDMKASADGTKITFSLNTEMGKTIEKKKKTLTQKQIDIWKQHFPPVPLGIRVETEYGRSNPLTFTYLFK